MEYLKKEFELQCSFLKTGNHGKALPDSFFRRRNFHCNIEKRRGKLGRNVSFNGRHVLLYKARFSYDEQRSDASDRCYLELKGAEKMRVG